MLIKGIKKPFPEFKWRWATFEPSEGLNDPRVHLGVLRVLSENAGEPPNSLTVQASFEAIERDLAEYLPKRLRLARSQERNLLRNSQQYWSNLGLLKSTDPVIELTSFGEKVATGRITKKEFAATAILTLSLPNLYIERPQIISRWEAHNLEIKPLALLLNIIFRLSKIDSHQAYLSNEEVTKVVIPLSSMGATFDQHIEHVLHFRSKPEFFNSYEDFAPEANDKRITREFLLFLSHHGFLSIRDPSARNYVQKFFADKTALASIEALLKQPISGWDMETIAKEVSDNGAFGATEREKITVTMTSRPGQQKFRKEVLKEASTTCLLSAETFAQVLTACHIIPVEMKGSDKPGNGLCLREDLHILFDAGHLRIDSSGNIHLSDAVKSSPTYSSLPSSVELPAYVDKRCIDHRWRYLD